MKIYRISIYLLLAYLTIQSLPKLLADEYFNEWIHLDAHEKVSYKDFDLLYLSPFFESQKEEWFDGIKHEEKNIRLRYKAFVQNENKSNLIIIHGYGERIEKYKEFMYEAYYNGYNTFFLEQRGFGKSSRVNKDGTAVYVDNFQDYSEDVRQFITIVVNKRAPNRSNYIFAHSMGGLVAINILKNYPSLIKAAVLSTPMLDINTAPYPKNIAESIAHLATSLGFGSKYAFGQSQRKEETFASSNTGSFARWSFFHDFISKEGEKPYLSGGASFQWVYESLKMSREARQDSYASTISTPILLFQAGRDSVVMPDGQESFCHYAKNCELSLINESKHEIYRETDEIRIPYLKKIFEFYSKY